MDNTEKYFVERAFERIYFLPRLVGTFPLDHDYKLSWGILVFIADFILNLFIMVIEFSNNANKVEAYMLLVIRILALNPPFINFACVYFKVGILRDFFQELLTFEKFTRETTVVWTFRYKWWQKHPSWFFILISFVSIFWYANYSYSIPTTIKLVHYYIVIYSIAEQIFGTNSLLASAIMHLKHIKENKTLLRKFEQLVFLHRAIEDYFGLQILGLIVASFVSAVMLTFWLTITRIHLIIAVSFLFPTLYPLLLIYASLSSIVSQAKKIDKLLYKRLLENPNDELLEFHMIAKREISFTAFGFFKIDSSLISSMIGAATTYLVILLQYVK